MNARQMGWAVLFVVALGAAEAQNPHLIDSKTNLTIGTTGDLTIKWSPGSVTPTRTTFSGHRRRDLPVCHEKRELPERRNKTSFTEPTSTTGTFSPKNGNVNGALTLTAPECPPSGPPTSSRT